MKTLPLAILTCFISMLAHASDPIERPPLFLQVGEQRRIEVPGLARYSLGSDAVRVLAPQASPGAGTDTLLIKAVRPGAGDLWVWNLDGTSERRPIQVTRADGEAKPPALLEALGQLQECEVIYTGQSVTLRGEIRSLRESARLASLSVAFPELTRDETSLSEALLEDGYSALDRWQAKRLRASPGATRLELSIEGHRLLARGTVADPAERKRLEQEVRAIFPAAALALESLPDPAPTIHFKVFLLELKRSRFGALGLRWPSELGTMQASGLRGAPFTKMPIELLIQALEGDGALRVLSNPELVVRAPGEAELFSGGELPIRSTGQYHSNLAWKNYGLTLKLNVTHATAEEARLEIFTEVSHLDTETALSDVPGIQANRMKTQVDARFGTPLLLSGLLQEGTRKQARGLPLLQRIPVLGSLFGSQDYLNERSELVAVLLPSRSPPDPPRGPQTLTVGAAPPIDEPASEAPGRRDALHRGVWVPRSGALR